MLGSKHSPWDLFTRAFVVFYASSNQGSEPMGDQKKATCRLFASTSGGGPINA